MESHNLNSAKLGVLGGSGFYSIEDLINVREINVETPYGETSDSLRLGELNGIEVVFLARHGRNHTFTPSKSPIKQIYGQ